jgi:ParB-like chromosome segregation protein Spo0J
MAKRKRLTPANPTFLGAAPETKSALSSPMRAAPIADVAREASATAAAEELARSMTEAREGGRLVVTVPLRQVVSDYLVRDRVVMNSEEMQALKDSLRNRGQQTPVELVALEDGRYGLISGWRRCTVLRKLYQETGDPRFAEVQGLLRQPSDSSEAYLSMVEENEVRVGLSYFERARIVQKAVEARVFDSTRTALQTLFQSASRPKRSKIGSFVPVVQALDGALRFPEGLTERLGLHLSKALEADPALGERICAALAREEPRNVEEETALIEAALTLGAVPSPAPAPAVEPAAPATPPAPVEGLSLRAKPGRIVLEGTAVTEALCDELRAWLRDRGL